MKPILITRIRERADSPHHNPFDRSHRYTIFASKYISEDGGETFYALPDFPTDSRLPEIKAKSWYDALGEFVYIGDSRRDARAFMAPSDRRTFIYRVHDENDYDAPVPFDYENKTTY